MNAHKIKQWLLNNILTIIIAIGPGTLGVFATIFSYVKGGISFLDLLLIMILLVIILVIIIKSIWRHVNYKSYHYPWNKINTGYNYTVLKKEISYKRDESDQLHFSRSLKIKCCSNRLGYVFDKYIWTGEKISNIQIQPLNGIARIENKTRIGIWNYFVLELSNHIEKGEECTLSYKWPIISDCKKSSPFFSTSTDEPTQEVILSLELGEEYANQQIVCEEFRAIESDYPIYIKKDQLDDKGKYEWIIPKHKIKRFRHYRIRWSWTNGQPAAEYNV